MSSFLTSLFFFFFFSCSRDHRDLHSFPTRRSSDLNPRRIVVGALVGAILVALLFGSGAFVSMPTRDYRSEEHTSELQSRFDLVCRLLLEKKKKKSNTKSLEK